MSIPKSKILCVDFEFHEEIYRKIEKRLGGFDVTIVDTAKEALTLLENITFDFLLTTIVMPGEIDGLTFIDRVKASPEKYGTPIVAILTGLGGDKFHEEVQKRGVVLIDRYERKISDIEMDIDLFLGERFEQMANPYPDADVMASIENKELQTEVEKPSILESHHPSICSKCKSKEFKWIRFRSPKETWDMLCGRDAWLLICSKCRKQYEQIIRTMS